MLRRVACILLMSFLSYGYSFSQCPTNEADLANGGTFSGNCTINIGADIIITGAVIWNSGTLTLNGNNGDIDIDGGSLTINAGTVRAIDNNDGDLDVINGSVTIANGATLLLDESIEVFNGASITVSGTLTSQDNDIDINAGGTITVNATGSINAGDEILVQGTLINSGSVDANADITLSSTATFTNSGTADAGDDIHLDGTVTNSGTLDASDDLDLATGGSLTNSGTTHADNDIDLNGTVSNSGAVDAGNDVDIDGTMTSSGTIDGDDIDVDGSLTNSGTITADDQMTVTGTLVSSGDITTDNDFVVDGGNVTIQSGGTIDSNEDLKVYGGGTLTIDAGASVTVANDIINNSQANGGGPISQGSFIINGTLTGSDDFTIQNSTPNSSVTGTGTINIAGTYNDSECPATGNFCLCEGTSVGACNASGPLPVELISFSVILNHQTVEVYWATASELNNDYFTIERASDIEEFYSVGNPIAGHGTTSEKNSYSAKDENPLFGRSYYRLKQTDFDGAFTYSPVRVVDYEGPQFSSLRVSPNPTGGQRLTIEVTGLKNQPSVPVQIYNVQGQKVFDQILKVATPGSVKQTIEFATPLKQGLYIVKAGPTLQLTQRIVVQ